jgi:hypothetical protein
MKTKSVPATTNNITTGIINFLNSKGHLAIRINTSGIYDPVGRIFRKPDPNNLGCPDILCCMKDTATHSGYFVGIEIKNELTKDRMKEHQEKFHTRIKDAYGIIKVIHSYDEFLRWYNLSGF